MCFIVHLVSSSMGTPHQGFGRRVWLLLAMFATLAVGGRADPVAVVDDDGRFAANFPAAVKRTNRILDTDAGQIIMCQVNAAQGTTSFMVIYCDYPEGYVASGGASTVYKSAAKEAADNAKGTIRGEDSCKLRDVAGLEVLIDGPGRGFVERIRL